MENIIINKQVYIARDKCGEIYLYQHKPKKYKERWSDGHCSFMKLDDSNLISPNYNPQWEDKEPIECIMTLKSY